MKKTALYEQHVAKGGKMVPFAGWSMPLHYGSQLEEHHIVRRHVGLFDVSHMQLIAIEGQEATRFLRNLIANDVNKLYPGKALYSCLSNEEGGIKDDLIVYKLNEIQYILVVNAATADSDFSWIKAQAKGFSVAIDPFEKQALIAVQGPESKTLLTQANFYTDLKAFHCHSDREYFIARTGYTGEDGFEISVSNDRANAIWEQLIQLGAVPCGLGARDTLRLEAGLNLYGQDMDETTCPFESNLSWTVDLKDLDRAFMGRSALEKRLREGIEKKLVGLILSEQGIMRRDMSLYSTLSNTAMGTITSGGFSPTLNLSIALARIQNTETKVLEVEIRNKRQTVRIVALPFIRSGKATFEHVK